MKDTVELSKRVAEGIGHAIDQDVYTFMQPERMALIVLILKKMPDNDDYFPRGQWATIQVIEGQLNEIADTKVAELKAARAAIAKAKGE